MFVHPLFHEAGSLSHMGSTSMAMTKWPTIDLVTSQWKLAVLDLQHTVAWIAYTQTTVGSSLLLPCHMNCCLILACFPFIMVSSLVFVKVLSFNMAKICLFFKFLSTVLFPIPTSLGPLYFICFCFHEIWCIILHIHIWWAWIQFFNCLFLWHIVVLHFHNIWQF